MFSYHAWIVLMLSVLQAACPYTAYRMAAPACDDTSTPAWIPEVQRLHIEMPASAPTVPAGAANLLGQPTAIPWDVDAGAWRHAVHRRPQTHSTRRPAPAARGE